MTSPAIADAARRNGRKMRAAPPPADPAEQPRDELDSIRRLLARLDAAAEALYDPARKLAWRERNRELRALARAMGSLVPKARLRRAELLVRGEAAQIAATGRDAPMEPVPDDGAED